MASQQKPWLEYSGQTTAEIIGFKETHRIDSLLCALEEGLLKRQPRKATPEEELLLAVMALQREVNNGGYDQFFVNSSRQYAPMIVQALGRIGCDAVAAITAETIAARGSNRKRVLNACDQQFYKLTEIEPKLFAFVDKCKGQIVLEKTYVAPRPPQRGFTNVSSVYTKLQFAKATDFSFDALRQLAAQLAAEKEIAASDAELEGATCLLLFSCHVRAGDLDACEALAPRVFELIREDTTHLLVHKEWVAKLIGASRQELADRWSIRYLEYLHGDDTSSEFIQKRVHFWAGLVRSHLEALPDSVRFLRTNFPNVDLDPKPTKTVVFRPRTLPKGTRK